MNMIWYDVEPMKRMALARPQQMHFGVFLLKRDVTVDLTDGTTVDGMSTCKGDA